VVLGGAVRGGCGSDGVGRVSFDDLEALRGWDREDLVSLKFETAVEDTDAHHGQKVVSSVGVIVNATEESGRSILAEVLLDQVLATGMLIHESGNVVDEAGDEDQRTSLGLLLEGVPADDGEVVGIHGPLDLVALSLQLLQFHGQLSLLDFVLGESLELVSQAEPLHSNDEPLGGVVLVPSDGVAVVHGELVVEVVVAFTHGDESGDEVVTGSVLVIEGRFAEVVGKGVDAEGRMMDESRAHSTSVEETTLEVSPKEAGNEGRDDVAHEDQEPDVVVVLPADDPVLAEVADVGDTRLATGLDEHPTHVRPPETLVSRVRVKVGVGVAVVGTVTTRPPLDGTLDGASTSQSEPDFKSLGGIVGAVSPETMIASSDAQSSNHIPED
jgi:hypothetical protein